MRAEVLIGPERRRRWSVEEKARIVGETRQAGVTVADAARRHDLSRNLIYTWRRNLERELTSVAAVALPSLVPVVLDDGGSAATAVQTKRNDPVCGSTRSDGVIEITLPGDVRITVRGRIEEGTLRAVMSTLRSA